MIVAVPFCGIVTFVMMSGSDSASVSLERTAMSRSGVSSGVVTKSSFATGGVLMKVFVMVQIASSPSETEITPLMSQSPLNVAMYLSTGTSLTV